jgi:hypothetical protein
MTPSETAKPATADTVNGLQIEQLGGQLNSQNSPATRELQALRLKHRFGFAFETAASLAWGMAR